MLYEKEKIRLETFKQTYKQVMHVTKQVYVQPSISLCNSQI